MHTKQCLKMTLRRDSYAHLDFFRFLNKQSDDMFFHSSSRGSINFSVRFEIDHSFGLISGFCFDCFCFAFWGIFLFYFVLSCWVMLLWSFNIDKKYILFYIFESCSIFITNNSILHWFQFYANVFIAIFVVVANTFFNFFFFCCFCDRLNIAFYKMRLTCVILYNFH